MVENIAAAVTKITAATRPLPDLLPTVQVHSGAAQRGRSASKTASIAEGFLWKTCKFDTKKKPLSRETNPKHSCFAAAALIAAKHAAGQGLIHRSEQLFAEGFLFCCVGVRQKQTHINSCKINKDEPLNTTEIMMWVEQIAVKDREFGG